MPIVHSILDYYGYESPAKKATGELYEVEEVKVSQLKVGDNILRYSDEIREGCESLPPHTHHIDGSILTRIVDKMIVSEPVVYLKKFPRGTDGANMISIRVGKFSGGYYKKSVTFTRIIRVYPCPDIYK